eukprot:11931823-Ditylum_brightwellii.AAC.1
MSRVRMCSRWTVWGITCPFYAAASREKKQEAVNFLEKKVDNMKGYELDLTIAAAIMCLGTVMESDFIMVEGRNGALGQAVIQIAAIGCARGIYATAWKENACVVAESCVD